MRSRASAAALSACSVATTTFAVATRPTAALFWPAFVVATAALLLFENAAGALRNLRLAFFTREE